MTAAENRIAEALRNVKETSAAGLSSDISDTERALARDAFQQMLGGIGSAKKVAASFLELLDTLSAEASRIWNETTTEEQEELVAFNLLLNDMVFRYMLMLKSPHMDPSVVTTLQSFAVMCMFRAGRRRSAKKSRSLLTFSLNRPPYWLAPVRPSDDFDRVETQFTDDGYDRLVTDKVLRAMRWHCSLSGQEDVKEVCRTAERSGMDSALTFRRAASEYLRFWLGRSATKVLMVTVDHSLIRAVRAGNHYSLTQLEDTPVLESKEAP